ncbi:MAG: OprO/OprP family phosphate-selective porin [Bacteroidales bacterium]|nr:OprO/OprP family phosphate-selective porin [Bacteroidales bacterium]
MKNYLGTAVFCALFLAVSAQAQENPSLDDQLRAHLHKEYFTLNLLIQSEGRFAFEDNDFQGGRTFNAANARISLRGNLKGGFFYRIFVNAAPKPALLDAFAGYKLNDAFSFMVGSMKPSQTLDFIPDPGSHNFVDRTNMTGLLVGSRETGIAATGDIGGFYYYTGIFNGSGLDNNNNNKLYGIGRLQYTVKNNIPGYIQFAVSGSHGNSGGITSGTNGPMLRGRRTILGSDLELELSRLYFAAEYLQGSLETVDLPNINDLISGYYFTGGLRWSEKTMTLARWQSWSFKEAGTTESKLTLGTNIGFTDIVGLVLNLDMYKPDQGDALYGASFIFQVQF